MVPTMIRLSVRTERPFSTSLLGQKHVAKIKFGCLLATSFCLDCHRALRREFKIVGCIARSAEPVVLHRNIIVFPSNDSDDAPILQIMKFSFCRLD